MPAVREVPGLHLLRPLLGVPKARLIATLEATGQPWLDDPSNRAPRFARSRLRRGPGLDAPALGAAAAVAAAERAQLDLTVAAWLAEAVRIDPAGFARLPRAVLAGAPPALARRALQQILATVGGGAYPPRGARLERLLEMLRALATPVRQTLAGCRIVDLKGTLLVCREAGAIAHVAPLRPQGGVLWDDRFALQVDGAGPELCVRALGGHPRAPLSAAGPGRRLPGPVRPSLPALWQGGRLLAVPHLGLRAPGLDAPGRIEVRFQPRHPLAGPPFGAAP
jgi:tRNA(Ile)-lysidine synthase